MLRNSKQYFQHVVACVAWWFNNFQRAKKVAKSFKSPLKLKLLKNCLSRRATQANL